MMKQTKKPTMKKFSLILPTLMGLFAVVPAYAQDTGNGLFQSLQKMNSEQTFMLVVLGVVLGLIILLLTLLVYLMSFLSSALGEDRAQRIGSESWWISLKQRYITGKIKTVPEKEEAEDEIHNYDGITELDNFMPPWLQYVFFLSIGFGIIYFINYTVLGWGKTQLEEYDEELYLASIEAENRKLSGAVVIDETNVSFDKTPAALEDGKNIYDTNCVACHASDGGGGVGPNLTDEYWIHGGSISDVFTVVKYGVPEKGMIPWQGQLNPEQMQNVSSYVLTLVGSTPLSPKEPEGDLYEVAIEEPLDALSGEELREEAVE